MTKDEINKINIHIAECKKIAKFCGIKDLGFPNYFYDLNAIYKAEKQLLSRDDADVYWPLYTEFLDKNTCVDLAHIPAIIKAECLVEIINLIELAELEDKEDEE